VEEFEELTYKKKGFSLEEGFEEKLEIGGMVP